MKGRPYPVRIRIESIAGDERLDQTVEGTAYRHANGWYLRYEERDDAGGILRTTVKLAGDEWVVLRRGAVEADLRFAPGKTCRGRYRFHGLELPLSIRLRSNLLHIENGRGEVRIEYDMSIGGEPEQRHSVSYRLEPVDCP